LFESFDIGKTTIQSGNLLYNGFLTTDGSFIYYQSDDNKSLVKSDYNGHNPIILSARFPSFINVLDNNVFYIEGASSGKVYKVDTDGKSESLVVDKNVKFLIVNSEFLFYIDTNDGFVYSVLHDGSKKRLLFNLVSSSIQLENEILYIQVDGLSNTIYKIPIEKIKNFVNEISSKIADLDPSENSQNESSSDKSVISNGFESSVDSEITFEPFANGISPIPEVLSDPIKISKSDINLKNINIEDNKFFFVDSSNNSFIAVSENSRVKTFLKKSILSPFIVSQEYLYYINTHDESRLYRVATKNSSNDEMIVNDRVNQFVVCGNSIYYKRENNMEIYRTSVDGGISSKIT